MPINKRSPQAPEMLLIFPSELGWMAAVVADATVKRLTFGHASAVAAKKAMTPTVGCVLARTLRTKPADKTAGVQARTLRVVRRLQAFAAGKPDALGDVAVDPGPLSDFQRRVLRQCRRIPYGHTVSYDELAVKAGCPGAARAVGNCMAGNRIPLIVPCHRVVRSDGRLGSYSAPGGTAMKRRLLALESRNWPRIG
jgi:methylated-DNA-[protein]-cysteine S-methyltransferase